MDEDEQEKEREASDGCLLAWDEYSSMISTMKVKRKGASSESKKEIK